VPYLTGRKSIAFYRFRRRNVAAKWEGFSDAPTYAHAREIADALIEAFLTPTEEGGVDEIHVVFTRFVSMLTQRVDVIRMLPLEVVEGEEPPPSDEILPLYDFEPDAETVLDELLPLYVASRIHYCLLQGAASELASRQKAMKSATDNAQQLIERLTREANQARQAEITQEISEIVGGASALAEATAAAD
jgi:F-type H+-transporting ATPase subunit gamma